MQLTALICCVEARQLDHSHLDCGSEHRQTGVTYSGTHIFLNLKELMMDAIRGRKS